MLKLVSSVIVVLAIATPYFRKQLAHACAAAWLRRKRGGAVVMLKIEKISKTFNPGTVHEKAGPDRA